MGAQNSGECMEMVSRALVQQIRQIRFEPTEEAIKDTKLVSRASISDILTALVLTTDNNEVREGIILAAVGLGLKPNVIHQTEVFNG